MNGYSFVTAPSPIPGVDASPLMTWGEVEGTPFQLDGSQTPLLKKHTPGPTYRMPKLPNRLVSLWFRGYFVYKLV